MCGVVGIVALGEGDRARDRADVEAMARALRHRGPNASGVIQTQQASFGHRRLSVVDLSADAAQPMRAQRLDGSPGALLSYNGEVYNHEALRDELRALGHTFVSRSDTEVVLRAYLQWGDAFLARLNGMFALAIWDERERRLLLARDPFGQKPLYYHHGRERFAFASELRAIELASPGLELDRSAVAKYLCFDGFPAASTPLSGVEKLPPGGSLVFRPEAPGELERRHPPPRRYGVRPNTDPDGAASELWERLVRAVRRRQMSDVPLGVFLSGGVDSSAIVAALATSLDPREIQTFSLGFERAGFDESQPAQRVAAHFGTKHRSEVLSDASVVALLPEVLDHLDEPLADASIVPTYALARFARRHVTVALGGDGGDELFAGYDTVLAERLARPYLRLPAWARAGVRGAVERLPLSADKRSLQFRASRFVRGLDPDPLVRNQRWFGSFLPEEASALVKGAASAYDLYEDVRALQAPPGEDGPLELWTSIYLPACVLTKVDRASMAVSLEARAPFLDPEFAAFAVGLPFDFKLRGATRKWILKRALQGRLPDWVLRRSKQGFGAPCGEWLRGPLRDEGCSLLAPARLARQGLLDPQPVTRLLDQHLSGRHDHRKRLWALYVLQRWLERRRTGP